MAQRGPDRARKVGIVGTGMVGSSFAYALMQRGLATEIVLVDANHERAEGEAMDLMHGVPFVQPMRITAGDYPDLSGCELVVITAGANQRPGETRTDLLGRNVAICREIVPKIVQHNPDGLICMTSNPVDILTYVVADLAKLPPGRVFGSGTILDTARLRSLLGQHVGVDPQAVEARVIGEHGDSQVPVWSLAAVAGIPLTAFGNATGVATDAATLEGIASQTRKAGPAVAERKGATYYGVAAGLVRITEAVLRDEHAVLTVSTVVDGYQGVDDVALSVPCVVGRSGIERTVALPLSDAEAAAFRHSADVLREAIRQLPAG